MQSDELAQELEAREGDNDTGAEEAAPLVRLFVFSVGDSRFALPPEEIREIVLDLEVFPLPACPPYLAGLINCHGKPFTVFDLRVLFEGERQEPSKFLVLGIEGDSVALGCTEVDEIVEVPATSLSTFAGEDAEARFCSAILALDGARIPVLSIPAIQRRLENDLA